MKLYDKIHEWVTSFVPNRDEAFGLTNQIHYIAQKHSKSSFTYGLICGAGFVLIILKWIS